MPKKLMEIASEIVQTQASKTSMTAADVGSSLRQVFSTLQELQRAEAGEIELPKIQESAPAQVLAPKDSIQNDKVICLECGAEMRWLTQEHLVAHGMDQREYREKYGFTKHTPLAAKFLTKAWSKGAKKRGLPENLKKFMETRRLEKDKASKPITPENSIRDDKVICLECGAEFKQLTQKHLISHGMDKKEYRRKYGFRMQTPLAAKSLIETRQNTAKQRGLPEKLKQYQEAKRQEKAKTVTLATTETVVANKPNRTKLRKKRVA